MRKTGNPTPLPKRAEPVPPTGQDFMGIGLVTDIPDQLIFRSLKNVMKRNHQIHRAQRTCEMSTGFRNFIDDRLANFSGHLRQLIRPQLL